MSNSATEATSTIDSSINWPSPTEQPSTVAIVACGALGPSIREIVDRRHWAVEVHLLPALLHNHPRTIAPRVEGLVLRLREAGQSVILAYADCGTYGALDDICTRLGVERLRGQHCYDLFAGADTISDLFADEPGTYLLTDFLLQTFRRTVLVELGLDRHPELWSDYFGHYRRVVWLAQRPTAELDEEARAVAALFSLPLEQIDVAIGSLEHELSAMLETISRRPSTASVQRSSRA